MGVPHPPSLPPPLHPRYMASTIGLLRLVFTTNGVVVGIVEDRVVRELMT